MNARPQQIIIGLR